MKKVLIISPYFPPVNAADMQRVRISLPYFKENGWEPTVVTVDERHAGMVRDELLLAGIPDDVRIIKVGAFKKELTAKLGLGAIALRSLFQYRRTVNSLLKGEHFDLVYFSTTQFPVCALGRHWKQRFGVPYVIDMQDPWYSQHYYQKPKEQRPPKYRLMYALHKQLERIAMSAVDGLIAVSADYIDALKSRYAALRDVPSSVITFGAFEQDMEIAGANQDNFTSPFSEDGVNVVYIGRGGPDMHMAIVPVFKALRSGLDSQPELFARLRFYFIGTSYARNGTGVPTIQPLAVKYGVADHVTEITDRISYYDTLSTLQHADALFIPGSDDPKYTASKIYPYLLTKKPLLAIFNKGSSVVEILKACTQFVDILTFEKDSPVNEDEIFNVMKNWANNKLQPVELNGNFNQFSAGNLTRKQTELFDKALKHFEATHTNA